MKLAVRDKAARTLQVRLEGILGGLQTLLGLEPDQTELVLDVVDHDGLALTSIVITALGGGVGALELEVLVLLLEVLAAVGLPEDGAVSSRLDVEGIRENLVSGDDVLRSSVDESCIRLDIDIPRR